jgi:Zn-dependent peptidase ImmA (M78 family)/DNA-binding XRE family transcriptional regulator
MAEGFNGRRARVARRFSGLTQSDLAETLNLTQPWIGQIESGARSPASHLVEALGEALHFTPAFFYGPLTNEFTEEDCHFRRNKTSTAAAKHQALSSGTLFAQFVEYLEQHVDFPSDRVPLLTIESDEQIERIAERCRLEWGLGLDRPIHSMTRLAETLGIVVTRCASSDKVDAFSRGTSGRKIIVVNETKGGSRTRFDLAHEIGHLVFHRGKRTGDDVTEGQANRFASAFLLPRDAFLREFPDGHRIDWDKMLMLKRRWGVSLAAMVRRARDLGRLSPIQYTSACKHISWNGWSKAEPHEPPVEQPESVASALSLLQEDGMSLGTIAKEIRMSELVLCRILGIEYADKAAAAPVPAIVANVVDLSAMRQRREQS